MAQEFNWGSYQSGWCPSDDAQNGRKDALFQMNNLELDKNGTLSLTGGTTQITSYLYPAFNLFPTTINGAETIYATTGDAKIYRNSTILSSSGGSESVSAFDNGIGNVLIASGTQRLKDDGTTVSNLGLGDANSFSLTVVESNYTSFLVVDGTTITWAVTGGASGGSVTSGATASPSTQFTWTGLTIGTNYNFQISSTPAVALDWSTLPNGPTGTTTLTEENFDVFNCNLFAINFPLSNATITINLLSGAGNSFTTSIPSVDGLYSPNIVAAKRSDFTVGSGTPSWSNITGIQVLVSGTATYATSFELSLVYTDIPVLGITNNSFAMYRGIHNDDSPQVIEYFLQLAASNGNYTAVSGALYFSTLEETISVPPGANVQIAYTASTDPQVTNFYIFRRGADLGSWYRAAIQPNTTANYVDNNNDLDVLDTDVVLNTNLTSLQDFTSLPTINQIVGPMEGRWWYYTDTFFYPSDINDPDVVDVSQGIRSCGDTNEIFLFSVKVAEGYILVATTIDFYVFSGTFQTLPDGDLDVYFRPMVCKFPPISKSFTFANGLIYYMAADGWRSIGTTAESSSLIVAPNTDQLYGITSRYGYSEVVLSTPPLGSLTFPITSTKNKLWCCVNDRIEVYDFVRKYWRPLNYGIGAVTSICASPLGLPVACFTDSILRHIADPSSYLVDGENLQSVTLLSPVFDPKGGLNRNDLYTFKVRLLTGEGEVLNCALIDPDGNEFFLGAATSPTAIQNEVQLDIFSIITYPIETFQIKCYGNFSRLVITDFRVMYDERPSQQTSMRGYNTNFGSAGPKRLRTWPLVIDTLGNNVTFTPFVDNVRGASTVFMTTEKVTVPVFLNYDAFGVDYGYTLTGGPFEFWEALQPEIVQSTPTPKQFDQIGPQELFRYGKIRELEVRILPLVSPTGTTSILPFQIYFDDNSVYNSTVTVNNGQEQSYSFGTVKGTVGTILRVELGPVEWSFIRYSMRAKVMVSGTDTTDNSRWITLG